MRILLAFDKFKGTLTAKAASEAVMCGLQRAGVQAEFEICPIADGGEGFTDAMITALGGEWREAQVHDAQGREITARYGLIHGDGKLDAVMEMSAASGLAIVRDLPLDPRTASTRGTGEMMLDAMEQGVHRIIIGIGGSATNDGGSGMASVLGYEFLDEAGRVLAEMPRDLEGVSRIAKEHRIACEVLVASDVTNPLLGEHGATRVYGGQKGVTDFAFFESRLQKLADLVTRDFGCDHREVPGAGAAGGLGFGLMSFCGAQLRSGFDLVAEITSLRDRIAKADLVLTGEGKLDGQTLHGKGPMGVAQMAREFGKPVAAIAGIIEQHPALQESFGALIQAKPQDMPSDVAMKRAPELLEECVARNAGALTKLALDR